MQKITKFLEKKKPFINSIMKKYIPEQFNDKYLEWALGKARYAYSIEALNRALAEPIWDFLNRGGKRWRPALFLLITEALGGNIEKVQDFVALIELIHNGTIMVDDIEDNSELRRGKPCTHKLFGTDIAINAGNAMYFFPLLILLKNKEKFDTKTLLKVWETYAEEMINISCGQATDIAWHKGIGNANNITENEYLQMCALKTGCLARLAARLAVIFSNGSKEQEEKIGFFAETIGIAFQIQDDVLGISSKKFAKKKGYGDDITEGKRNLMVIHTLKTASQEDRKKLIEILNMHARDPKLITEAINILHKYDSINYAKNLAKKLVIQAWNEIDPLLPESDAKQKLKSFADFLIKRDI